MEQECKHGLNAEWCTLCLKRDGCPDDEIRIAVTTPVGVDRYRIVSNGTVVQKGWTIYDICLGNDPEAIATVNHFEDEGPYHLAAKVLTRLAHHLSWER